MPKSNYITLISRIVLFLMVSITISSADDVLLIENKKKKALVRLSDKGKLSTNLAIKEEKGGSIDTDDEAALTIKYKGGAKAVISDQELSVQNEIREEEAPSDPSQMNLKNDGTTKAALNGDNGNLYVDELIPFQFDNLIGPASVKNYLYDEVNGKSKTLSTTVFSDGFGRAVQAQAHLANGEAIVSGIYYDKVGRLSKELLPIIEKTDGNFVQQYRLGREHLLDKTKKYYKDRFGEDGNYPYSETHYDDSPFSRVTKVGTPGKEYAIRDGGHYSEFYNIGLRDLNRVTFPAAFARAQDELFPNRTSRIDIDEYFDEDLFITNELIELPGVTLEDKIILLKFGMLFAEGEYKYYLSITKDTEGRIVQNIVDKFGRVLRSCADNVKRDGTVERLVTRSVYNVDGSLQYVQGAHQEKGKTEYTERVTRSTTSGQLLEVEEPGKGVTRYTYNAVGRPVTMTRVGEQGETAVFETDYDELGRVTIKYVTENGALRPISRTFYDELTDDNIAFIKGYLPTQQPGETDPSAVLDVLVSELKNTRGKAVATMTIGYNDSKTTMDPYKTVIDMVSFTDDHRLAGKYKFIPGIHWQKTTVETSVLGKLESKTVYRDYDPTRQEQKTVSFSFDYDQYNRLETVYYGKDAGKQRLVTYEYTELGKPKTKRFYNRLSDAEIRQVNYAFNMRSNLTEIDAPGIYNEVLSYEGKFDGTITHIDHTYHLNGQTKKYSLDYKYDKLNNLISVTSTNRGPEGDQANKYSEAFSYNSDGSLRNKVRGTDILSDNDADYVYESISIDGHSQKSDKVRNVTSLHGNERNYHYDGYGNITVDKKKKMRVTHSYWDMPEKFSFFENVDSDGDEQWKSRVSMVYDAGGMRVLKKTEKRVDNGTEVVTEAYAGSDFIYKQEGSNESFKLTRININTPAGQEGVITVDPNDVTKENDLFMVKDHLGSTRSVVSGKDGSVVEATMYSAFGEMEEIQPSSGEPVKEKFTTKEFDTDGKHAAYGIEGMGLYYFGFRFYDPVLGKFTTPDPVREFWDSYNYVGNNPINSVDLWGLSTALPVKKAGDPGVVDPQNLPDIPNKDVEVVEVEVVDVEVEIAKMDAAWEVAQAAMDAMSGNNDLPSGNGGNHSGGDKLGKGAKTEVNENQTKQGTEGGADGKGDDNSKGNGDGNGIGDGKGDGKGKVPQYVKDFVEVASFVPIVDTFADIVGVGISIYEGDTWGAIGGVAGILLPGPLGGMAGKAVKKFGNSSSFGKMWGKVKGKFGGGAPKGKGGGAGGPNGGGSGKGDGGGGKKKCPHCFEEGTLVLTENGFKPIEEVEAGELVLCVDEATGEEMYMPVVETYVTAERPIGELVMTDPTGYDDTLHVTGIHPFFIRNVGWTNAENLTAGDTLVTADSGFVVVKHYRDLNKNITVYNFQVAQNHNYFVTKQKVLVHNCDDEIPSPGTHNEVYANKPIKSENAVDEWENFLGEGPYSNVHPRTGQVDADRIVSKDGKRSIRYGSHEMGGKPTKHHYHEETWNLDPVNNTMNVENTVKRVPIMKKKKK